MNFEKIAPTESGKALLDVAFRKAREKGKQKNLSGNWLQIIRQKEMMKFDIIKDVLVTKLEKTLADFPKTSELPDFYVSLMRLTMDFVAYKQSCGGINWAIQSLRNIHRDYVRRVVKEKQREKIKLLSNEFYGRISSIIKQIDPQISYLEQCRKTFRTYPDIREIFTVCIYGFPNVGKTTLLNHLTETNAKTAPYAFTTKTINVGYFTIDRKKVQVLDVPGTLSRFEKMNNIELQAELVLKELADIIVYVFDITEQSGYTFENQEALLKKIEKSSGGKKILIYLSRIDLLDKEEISSFTYHFLPLVELKKEIITHFREKINPDEEV